MTSIPETSRPDPSLPAAPGRTDPAAAAVVYYDAGCPLCRREIAVYQRMAGAEAVTFADARSATPPEGLTRADLLARFTAIRGDGRRARGASGFAALWRALPRLARLGRIADTRVVLAVAEPAYRGFLRLRRLWR